MWLGVSEFRYCRHNAGNCLVLVPSPQTTLLYTIYWKFIFEQLFCKYR
jgi:hypothetical protein